MPDLAAAEAESWLKHGGGDEARLCLAFAQFRRGDFINSAHGFASLAASYDKTDAKNAAVMHAQAGLAFMRANDNKNAETEYAAALKIAPDDLELRLDRATERAADQHYWDALDDLDRVLKTKPDTINALRLRGQVWSKLGNDRKAEDDFARVEELQTTVKTKP